MGSTRARRGPRSMQCWRKRSVVKLSRQRFGCMVPALTPFFCCSSYQSSWEELSRHSPLCPYLLHSPPPQWLLSRSVTYSSSHVSVSSLSDFTAPFDTNGASLLCDTTSSVPCLSTLSPFWANCSVSWSPFLLSPAFQCCNSLLLVLFSTVSSEGPHPGLCLNDHLWAPWPSNPAPDLAPPPFQMHTPTCLFENSIWTSSCHLKPSELKVKLDFPFHTCLSPHLFHLSKQHWVTQTKNLAVGLDPPFCLLLPTNLPGSTVVTVSRIDPESGHVSASPSPKAEPWYPISQCFCCVRFSCFHSCPHSVLIKSNQSEPAQGINSNMSPLFQTFKLLCLPKLFSLHLYEAPSS